MDFHSTLGLALPLGVGIAAIGSGVSLGMIGSGALQAMGRQPEAIAKLQTAMIIIGAFAEALTIYAFVTVFLLMGKIG
jgi:F-type H+-transporting ATPase subunit c